MTDPSERIAALSNLSSIDIEGLEILENFIDQTEEMRLLTAIDCQQWSTALKRRVQHYGYRYDYKARAISRESYLGSLPEWTTFLIDRFSENETFEASPDQAIVNEYQPGQGIAPHVDCVPCFANTIASLSLRSACQMTFSKVATDKKVVMTLPPRSLLILRGEARYHWTHAIAPRKSDLINGERAPRGRRISITFRKVMGSAAR